MGEMCIRDRREGVFFFHEHALTRRNGVGVSFAIGHFIQSKLLVFLVAGFEDKQFPFGCERQQDGAGIYDGPKAASAHLGLSLIHI